MPTTQPRNRRIIIMAVIGLLVILLVGLRFAQQQNRRASQTQDLRAQGIGAFETGDFEAAAEQLGGYLDRDPDADATAYYTYAQAAMRVAAPGGANRAEALRAMSRAVRLDPQNLDRAHELLEHLAAADAVAVIEEVLKTHPDDPILRRRYALALAGSGRLVDANQAVQAYLEEFPLDTDVLALSYRLRTEAGIPGDALVSEARTALADAPQDPRAMLALALALDLRGDQAEARQWVQRASEAPLPDDPRVLESLIRFHDATNQFAESLALLRRHHSRLSPALRSEFAARLYEVGQMADVVAVVEAIPARDRTTTQEAMRAIALRQLGRTAGYENALAALEARSDGGSGDAWAALLRGIGDAGQESSQNTAGLIRDALELDVTSPLLHLLRGDAMSAAGQTPEAAQHFEAAAQLRATWDAPRVRLANQALADRDLDRANRLAIEAYLRAPRKIENIIMLVAARSQVLQPGQTQEARELLRQIDAVQEAAPGEPTTAVIRPQLLAVAGQKGEASQAIAALLEREPALDRDALVRLAQIDAAFDLGQAAQIHAVTEKAHGHSSRLTFIEAMRLGQTGQVDAGLTLIDASKPADASDPAWSINRARFIERFRPAEAHDEWSGVAAAYPDALEAQLAAAQAPCMANDRAFLDQTINRIRELEESSSGDEWRTLRARWLLSLGSGAGNRADAQAALDLLTPVLSRDPSRTDVRILVALAQERMGDLATAARTLESAGPDARDDARIAFQQARLYELMGRSSEAASRAGNVLADGRVHPDQRAAAAAILIRNGRGKAGFAEYDRLLAGDSLGVLALLEYAALLRQRGERPDDLAKVIGQLEASDQPQAILFAARHHHEAARPDAAARALARIDALGLDPLDRHELLADYHRSVNQPEQALAHMRAAVDLAPDRAGDWHRLIGHLIEQGQGDQALSQTRLAASHHPDDPAVQGLLEREGPLRASAQNPGLRALLVAALTDPEHRALAFEAIDVMSVAQAGQHTLARTAEDIVMLAQRDPTFDVLQHVAASLLYAAGQPGRAADMGLALMRRRPDLDSAARLATHALLDAQRWDEALVAATQWRRRAPGRKLEPDVAISRAKLRLNDAAGAMRAIAPYRAAIEADPDAMPVATVALARVLIVNGQRDAAYSLMAPLSKRDADWRVQYLLIGTSIIRGQQEALDWLLDPAGGTDTDEPRLRLMQVDAVVAIADRHRSAEALAAAAKLAASIEAKPDAPAMASFVLGTIHEKQGDFAAAEQAYRRALAAEPGKAIYANNLAMALAHQNKSLDEAIKLAQGVCEAQPNDPNYFDTLAYVLLKADRCDQALAAIERAIALAPQDAQWIERRAEIREHCAPKPVPEPAE